MTLLTLIQEVTDLLGVPRPVVVVTSADQLVRQLLALAQEETRALAAEMAWPDLVEEAAFITAATSEQPGALPADHERMMPQTMWNRSTNTRLWGPTDAQTWQRAQVEPGILMWRIKTGMLMLWPVPAAGEQIAFEYVSKSRIRSADGTRKTLWTADDDEALLDEGLIGLGIRWRFKKAKGLDYAEDLEDYERRKGQITANAGGAPDLRIGGGRLVGSRDPFVREGSW